jgi:hypothetical protein
MGSFFNSFPKSFVLLVCCFTCKLVVAQDKIDTAMTNLFEKYPQEKVYIAYDRTDYLAGETIWFKGFVFSDYTLSDISTNLYVEMYNSHKDLIVKKTMPLLNGATEGSISIPDSTKEGVYYIRAYTGWMLNFNESLQYIQPILIYHPNSKLTLQKIQLPWSASIFAEGGTLLNIIESKITVRLNSDGDLPKNWQGYLVDSLNPTEKLVSFQSIDPNVAQFSFVPSLGKTYEVYIQDEKGITKTVPLPKVDSAGVHLRVIQKDSTLEYKVDFTNLPSQETYKLVGTIDNNLVYKATVKNEGASVVHSFSTTQMLKGVLRLTLFDKDYKVVSERLCFLYPDLEPKINIDSLALNNAPRAMNSLRISVDSGKTFCAMVIDANAANPFEKNNLLSKVWLTADFTNKIQDAEHYFRDKESGKALDALLISNRWERFNWAAILSNQFPEIKYPRDNYKSFIGTVYYKKKPLQNEAINLILFMPDSSKQLIQATTSINGKILLNGLLFEGAAKVVFQQTNKKINTDFVKIEFEPIENSASYKSPFPQIDYILSANTEPVSKLNVQERFEEKVKNDTSFSSKVNTLKEVKVYAKTKTPTQLLDEKLSSGRYYNPRETIYDFVNVVQDGTDSTNLHYWVKGRIPGYDIRDEWKGIITYYIDEFIVAKGNLSMLDALSISDVAMVKIQGKGQSHQVLIYLKKGGELVSSRKSLSIENLTGYEHEEIYRSLDYSKPESSKIKTDSRDLLYWGNNIYSDLSNQKYKITFFNSDKAKKYRLILFYVSNEDGPIYFEKVLE